MITNEKTFDENLKRIGNLYEEGKDLLHGLLLVEKSDEKSRLRLYDILREIRDIAAINLKANHSTGEN